MGWPYYNVVLSHTARLIEGTMILDFGSWTFLVL